MSNHPILLLPQLACVTMLVASCASPTGEPTPPPRHTPSQPVSTSLAPPSATAPFAPSPSSTPTPLAQLGADGPWLALLAGDTLVGLDADASSVVRLGQHEFAPWEVDFAVAPKGGSVGLKGSRDGLTLVSFPSMDQANIAELLPPEREYTEEELSQIYQWMDDTWAASLFLPSLAWSHDGSMLAFISGMNGVSPDIYLYNTEDGSTTRLTTAPTFAMSPEWSPDDMYILHDAANAVLWGKSGRGHRIASVWIAPSDLSTPRQVFGSAFADEKGFEHRLGWISDSVYVGSSEPEWCPPANLRAISIEDASAESLWEGSFFEAVLDPESATMLLVVPPIDYPWTGPECAPSQPSGLYIVSAASRSARRLGDYYPNSGQFHAMQWSPQAQLFFFDSANGLLSVTPAGDVELVTTGDVGFPEVSPDGRYWALPSRSGGVLSVRSSGGDPRPIYYGQSGPTTWAPDGSALFFLGEPDASSHGAALYMARPPDFKPSVVVDGLDLDPSTEISPFGWVFP